MPKFTDIIFVNFVFTNPEWVILPKVCFIDNFPFKRGVFYDLIRYLVLFKRFRSDKHFPLFTVTIPDTVKIHFRYQDGGIVLSASFGELITQNQKDIIDTLIKSRNMHDLLQYSYFLYGYHIKKNRYEINFG